MGINSVCFQIDYVLGLLFTEGSGVAHIIVIYSAHQKFPRWYQHHFGNVVLDAHACFSLFLLTFLHRVCPDFSLGSKVPPGAWIPSFGDPGCVKTSSRFR